MNADAKRMNQPDEVELTPSNKKDDAFQVAPTHKGLHPVVLIIFTLAIFFMSQVVIVALLATFGILSGADDLESFITEVISSNEMNFVISVGLAALHLGGVYWAQRVSGLSLRSLGLIKPIPRDIPRAIVGWLVYMILLLITVGLLSESQLPIDFDQEQQLEFAATPEIGGLLIIYASVVIIPAFIEEVLMRGFLFRGLRRRLNMTTSTLIVSLLFAIAHLQFHTPEPPLWSAFVDTFVLSVVLCVMTERFRSLWPAIFTHGIKNSIAFILIFVIGASG